MFEFTFVGENTEDGLFVVKGDTTDFLEFLCQLAGALEIKIAAQFFSAFVNEKRDDLGHLRVTRWNFYWSDGQTQVNLRKVA